MVLKSNLYLIALLIVQLYVVSANPIGHITIDGAFDDWNSIPNNADPVDDVNGTVLDQGVHDCHDTVH